MNYVDPQYELAFTAVEDKYGIMPLANKLLLAVHFADSSASVLEDDAERYKYVSENFAVVDSLVQLQQAVIDVSKDLGMPIEERDLLDRTNEQQRDDSIDDLHNAFGKIIDTIESRTKQQNLLALDMFMTDVNAFEQTYGQTEHKELTELSDRVYALKELVDDPNKLNGLTTKTTRQATLNDYIEIVQDQISQL